MDKNNDPQSLRVWKQRTWELFTPDEVVMPKKKSDLILIKPSGLIILQLLQRKQEDVKSPQMQSDKCKLKNTPS